MCLPIKKEGTNQLMGDTFKKEKEKGLQTVWYLYCFKMETHQLMGDIFEKEIVVPPQGITNMDCSSNNNITIRYCGRPLYDSNTPT